jgi:Asp-tRNA(Asn)/Glu-tRNA(Gln) amidotransferase A subunit family amidase
VAGRTATGLTMPRERYEAAVVGQLEVAAVAAKALAEFGCDAIAFPTVPVVAPETEVAMSASAEEDLALVGLLLRNNVVGNDLGVCAASLPVQHLDMEAPGALPVGLQLMGAALTDEVLMAAVCAVEGVVGQPTTPSPSL